MPRYGARVDRNQAEIVAYARDLGAEISHTHIVGGGHPDILVAWRDRWFPAEIKMPGEDLTPKEKEWHERMGRQAKCPIWRSCEDVYETLLGGDDGKEN